MDELAPSLRSSARGGSAAEAGGSDSDSADDVGDSAGGSKSEGETVIGRCAAAALSTGVDCVLDEEFSASREAGRVAGFPQVQHVPCLQSFCDGTVRYSERICFVAGDIV